MAKLLLIGNHRPSFAVARALHRAGHEIWAGSNGYSDYFELSNAVCGQLPLPDFNREAECIAVIEAHLRDHGFDALWPVTDRATRMVAKHRVRLVRHARIVSPPPGLIKTCVSKTAMATLCAELNVPVAPQTPVASREQIRKAGRSLGYPLVIKPTGEGEFIFGHKVITLNAEADLDSLFPEWPDNHVHLLVQQRLNGLRHNHYFVARDGVLLRGAAIEILRTDREDGSGYAVEGVSSTPRADLAEQTAKLVHALGYTGIGCAQYMTSEDRQASSFLEINPRLGANIAAAEITGADLVGQAFRLAFDEDVEVPADPWSAARTGLRYAWSKGDLSGLAWRYRQGAGIGQTLSDLGRLISSGAKADTHLVFDWHDPLPALACWAHPLIKRSSPETRPSPGTSIKAR